MSDLFVERDMERSVSEKLKEFPVVVLQGAPHVGMTTLANRLCDRLNGRLWTMNSMLQRARLRDDPDGLSDGLGFVAVDGIQVFPELVRAVKRIVDSNSRAGMFLLTSSAGRHRMADMFDTLGAKREELCMRPCSQFELRGAASADSRQADGSARNARGNNVIEHILSGLIPPDRPTEGLAEEVRKGGYPVIRTARNNAEMKEAYLYEELMGDLLESAGEIGLEHQQLLLSNLARSIGRVRNIRDVAENSRISEHMAKKTHDHLSNMFIIETVPSFGEKIRKRSFTATDKVYFNDCGLATTMLGLDGEDIVSSPHWTRLVENFVLAELLKHKELCSLEPRSGFCHYRETSGIKVDFILKMRSGCIAFGVNASKKVGRSDRSSLVEFKSALGKRCRRAIIFYAGEKTLKYDDGVEAWPISSLIEPW